MTAPARPVEPTCPGPHDHTDQCWFSGWDAYAAALDAQTGDDRAAAVWDEAVEATVQWIESCGRPGPNGPPDPPLNPYVEQAGGLTDD